MDSNRSVSVYYLLLLIWFLIYNTQWIYEMNVIFTATRMHCIFFESHQTTFYMFNIFDWHWQWKKKKKKRKQTGIRRINFTKLVCRQQHEHIEFGAASSCTPQLLYSLVFTFSFNRIMTCVVVNAHSISLKSMFDALHRSNSKRRHFMENLPNVQERFGDNATQSDVLWCFFTLKNDMTMRTFQVGNLEIDCAVLMNQKLLMSLWFLLWCTESIWKSDDDVNVSSISSEFYSRKKMEI